MAIKLLYKYSGLAIFFYFFIAMTGCDKDITEPGVVVENDYLKLPKGFPSVPAPEDNPITNAKAELGRKLFYETKLSKTGDYSCTQCHLMPYAFTSAGKVLSRLPDGTTLTRNALPLFNVGYSKEFFWDGNTTSIEEMMLHDLILPFIFNNDTNVILERLESDPAYPPMFKKAFGNSARPHAYLVAKALATFIRVMVSGNSPYDKYINGDSSALNEQEVRGMKLFFSSKANCSSCHSGLFFTDGLYHNTGTTTHYFDRGRFYVTGNPEDRGKFRTPTLRNIELTAPYLHEGEFHTLEQVINNYSDGGRYFINKDPLMKRLDLNAQEKSDLIAFLKALTDKEFISNPLFKPE